MISRLTACATLFAIVGAATLAVAAGSPGEARIVAAPASAEQPTPVVHLEPVSITVTRQPRASGAGSN